MKKVLVTGADGFIGSHLVEALVKNNFDVKAFVMYNSFGSWGWLDHLDENLKKEIDIFMGDIRDPNGVRTAIKGSEIVFHLAALIGIPYSYHSPDSYVDTNIKGTLNVLQASKDFNIKQIIHTSTSEVYGSARFVPITEDHPLQGQSPYSASKIGADQLALSFFNSFDLPVSIIRPFNTYGPRQSARAVIPTIITQIIQGKEEIKLGSTSPTRDFSYISDTVDGFISTISAQNAIGEVINLGNSFEVSIGETALLISKLMNKEIKILSDEIRIRPLKSEVNRLYSSNQKAKKLINWEPKLKGIEGFTIGLERTIDWFTNQNNLLKYKDNFYSI